jgi:putative oxidoreductase
MTNSCCGFSGFIKWLGDGLGSLILLAARLYFGWGLIKAGWMKFQDIPGTAHFFQGLNIPWPESMAYLVAAVELIGGALLLIGLFSRIVAIPLIILLVTIYVTTESTALKDIYTDVKPFISAAPFWYLVTVIAVFCFGPGKFSLDYWYGGRCSTTKEMP